MAECVGREEVGIWHKSLAPFIFSHRGSFATPPVHVQPLSNCPFSPVFLGKSFPSVTALASGNLGTRHCPQQNTPGAPRQPGLPLPEPGLPVPTVRRGAQPGTVQQEGRHRRGGVCDHQGCGECCVRPCHSREGLNPGGTLWLGIHTPRKSLGQLRAKALPPPRPPPPNPPQVLDS